QLLELVQRANRERTTAIVVDVEMKDPVFFTAKGIDVLTALVADLRAYSLIGPQAPVWLESFDHAFLRQAFDAIGNACFALLETVPNETNALDTLLHQLATWVRGIAPGKSLLWDKTGRDSGLVAAAHAYGLEAHSWTFREDRSPAP